MKPSSCTEGHGNPSRDKSPCSLVPRIPNLKIPLDPSIKTHFAFQMLKHVSLCWRKQTEVTGQKQKPPLVGSGDVSPQHCTTPPGLKLCQGALKISAITLPSPKMFKHILFWVLGFRFLILRIWGRGLTKVNHIIEDFKGALFHNFVIDSMSNTCIFLKINK